MVLQGRAAVWYASANSDTAVLSQLLSKNASADNAEQTVSTYLHLLCLLLKLVCMRIASNDLLDATATAVLIL